MKLLRYLKRDLVDLVLLLFFISVLIKGFINGWWEANPYPMAGVCFAILYIFGIMFRMGSAADIMNEYITDPAAREMLGMKFWGWDLVKNPIKSPIIELMFRYTFLALTVIILIFYITA